MRDGIVTETLHYFGAALPADFELREGRVIDMVLDVRTIDEKLADTTCQIMIDATELLREGISPLKLLTMTRPGEDGHADPPAYMFARAWLIELGLSGEHLGFVPAERPPLSAVLSEKPANDDSADS